MYQAQKGGRMYCESAKVVLWLSTYTQNHWKEAHPATSLLDFFKTGIVHFQSVLIWSDSLSGVDKLKLIAVPLSNQGFRKSAMSSLQARGVVWARRVSLMWLLIALLTFLLFFFSFCWVWAEESVCVVPLPCHEIQGRGACACRLFILHWGLTVADAVQASSYAVMFWLFNEAKRR